jgi:hypothetical protein
LILPQDILRKSRLPSVAARLVARVNVRAMRKKHFGRNSKPANLLPIASIPPQRA